MSWLQIRNWDKWQTYRKDRQQPPWIKLHRDLLRNPDWVALSDAQRGQLVSMWMLAADKNGRIPDDSKLIQRICFMDKEPDLNLFVAHGFVDAKPTPRRRRPDAPDKEADADKEAEKMQSGAGAPNEETPLSILNAVLDKEHSEAVLEFRAKRKQSNSLLAIRRLANQLAQHQSPNEGAAEMICRNWSGFNPSWMNGRGTGPPNQTRTQAAIINLRERAKHGNGRPGIRNGSGELPAIEFSATGTGPGSIRGTTDSSLRREAEDAVAEDGER